MQKLNLEPPPAKFAYRDSFITIIILRCEIASIFHVLTYTAATSHVADFSDED